MAELVREKVDGRMATVAYLSPDLDGELVEPKDADMVVVRFDNGDILYGLKVDADTEEE